MASQSPAPRESMEPGETPVKEEQNDTPTGKSGVSNEDYKIMKSVVDNLTEHKDSSGHDVAGLFQRLLNKRLIPDYFDVIKEPTAFSTIRGKIIKKQYKGWEGYVRDFALICHNAQVYNRPSAPVYHDAVALRELMKQKLAKLVDKGIITKEQAEFPDLGEIPEVEDSPEPSVKDEEPEEDDEEDEEDEEDDDSDDDGVRRRRRRGPRSSAAITKREGGKVDEVKDDAEHKKRGRPPKVHTPMEARINNVLKGLRKFKNPGGDLKILHFEKLPDKSVMPEYYQEIKTPMAMDLIKRKAKRKKYNSVDQVLKDLELMFENAKSYNLEDSQVYRDAVDLQKEARALAEQEKMKPDSNYVDEDGRLPLPEILHNGEIWKVGDWVHLQNPNDLTKPIVAQIYRTWQDSEGQKWINACWYYRPEQTVHRYEKHFFENEVVKTGQYRDHHIDEVVDRCFVMFFTRYNKGRPRGFPPDKEVYVCEARYNEEKFKLNKIKTWASCVPDEVRDKDYEMDLFDVPRKMKKVPSPIKHLLREDAKEDDPLPKPTWGAANAPPIVGAVHKRPREANESPPPEPTPSPPPQPPPEPVRRSVTVERTGSYSTQGDNMPPNSMAHHHTVPSPVPAHPNAASYGQQFAPSRPSASPAPSLHQQTSSYGGHASASHTPIAQTPSFTQSTNQSTNYAPYTAAATHSHGMPQTSTPNPLASYDSGGYRSSIPPSRTAYPTSTTTHTHTNAYNPPRPIEVYHLSDAANNNIPRDIRAMFHRDEHDRVLFFTAPPLDIPTIPSSTKLRGHNIKYLAKKARDETELAEKRILRNVENANKAVESQKRKLEEEEARAENIKRLKEDALAILTKQMDSGTEVIYKRMYGDEGKKVMQAEDERLAVMQQGVEAQRGREAKLEGEKEARNVIPLKRNVL